MTQYFRMMVILLNVIASSWKLMYANALVAIKIIDSISSDDSMIILG